MTRRAEVEALEKFVGVWNTTGTLLATKDAPALKLVATDTYEWLPGGYFLLHRVDARIGEQVSRSIEIVGWDAERGTLMSRSYDDQGASDEFVCVLDGRRWMIVGESMRFDGAFSEGERRLSGTWELRGPDGQWSPWMDIELNRAS